MIERFVVSTTFLRMFIFSKSMTRGIFAFKYEAEKSGGVRGSGVSGQ